MSELHILDAGRADCTVLLLDTPQGQQTVVVDGGGKYYGARRPLLEFLTQRNISDIDLLILTHLHQDHFGGLCTWSTRCRCGGLWRPAEIFSLPTGCIRYLEIRSFTGSITRFSNI